MTDLTTRQAKAVEALLSHPTYTEAAESLNLSERTLRRYAETEAVREALREATAEVRQDTSRRLARLAQRALGVLDKLLTAESEFVRLRAARAVLELGLKYADSVTLEERIKLLEDKLLVA